VAILGSYSVSSGELAGVEIKAPSVEDTSSSFFFFFFFYFLFF